MNHLKFVSNDFFCLWKLKTEIISYETQDLITEY
jgi:hypothetical protein